MARTTKQVNRTRISSPYLAPLTLTTAIRLSGRTQVVINSISQARGVSNTATAMSAFMKVVVLAASDQSQTRPGLLAAGRQVLQQKRDGVKRMIEEMWQITFVVPLIYI